MTNGWLRGRGRGGGGGGVCVNLWNRTKGWLPEAWCMEQGQRVVAWGLICGTGLKGVFFFSAA